MTARKKTPQPDIPTELQLKTTETVKKALAPMIKLRKQKFTYPDAFTVVLDVYPTFSMREEARGEDSIWAMLDEDGIKADGVSVGLQRKLSMTGDGGTTTTNIEVSLSPKQ